MKVVSRLFPYGKRRIFKKIRRKNRFVVTIGVFDGLHRGHDFILKEVASRAKQLRCPSLAITFWPHPQKSLNKNFLGHIMTLEDRIKGIVSLGIDYVWVFRINRSFLNTRGLNFMKNLTDRFSIKELVVGQDFKCGHRGLWTIAQIRQFCLARKINLRVVKKMRIARKVISSSLVRKLIREAKFKQAKRFLGRDYVFKSRVIRGTGTGLKLGCPTANLNSDSFLIPRHGVYAVCVYLKGRKYLGAVNIGRKPTVSDVKKISFEVHILNFDGNITGKEIAVIFLGRIRDEKKFPSLISLRKAIKKDLDSITAKYSVSLASLTQPIVV